MKRLTKKTIESNESSNESNESIHHIKEIKKIEKTSKHYTATIKMNAVKKEFIIDTGFPLTIMPMDKRKVKPTEIQKVTTRYHDVNKNEMKLRGKIPVDVECENNKQNMKIQITEKTDNIPLLEMDWIETFKLTIGKKQ